MTLIAATLQAFFTDRLASQRHASPRTITAYRDTLKLLVIFTHQRSGKPPTRLDWDDLDVTAITAFLNHLETERHNSIRTRNVRLTAIRSLFSFAALRHPEHALLIQRVLAIPPKGSPNGSCRSSPPSRSPRWSLRPTRTGGKADATRP
jgi:site-specific recombinase XerD